MNPRERAAVRTRHAGHPALRSWEEKERDAEAQRERDRDLVDENIGGEEFGDGWRRVGPREWVCVRCPEPVSGATGYAPEAKQTFAHRVSCPSRLDQNLRTVMRRIHARRFTPTPESETEIRAALNLPIHRATLWVDDEITGERVEIPITPLFPEDEITMVFT